jgi:creatinine amidohydrolase
MAKQRKTVAPLRTRQIEELTWQEFGRIVPRKTDTVLLPVGTIEAHGVTGLGTDNRIPGGIAGRIADRINALIAPAINYGITKSLLPHPGSVTVTPETFERYSTEVMCGLADAGFRRVVILNGHGGNTQALKNASFRLYQEKKVYSMVIDWWTLCTEEVLEVYGHAGGHAGTDETALALAIGPENVRQKEYSREMAFLLRPGLAAMPFPGSIMLYKENEGFPDFDPAKARELMDAVCARVADTILDVFKRWQRIR